MRIVVVSQARCPTPSRSLAPAADVDERRPESSRAPCASCESSLEPPSEIRAAGGSIQAGCTTKDTKSTKTESPRCRCSEPKPRAQTPSPHERSVSYGDPTCRSPLLRVLCFFVSFVLFVVKSGAPMRRPGPDEQDRRRRAAGFLSPRTRRARRPQRRSIAVLAWRGGLEKGFRNSSHRRLRDRDRSRFRRGAGTQRVRLNCVVGSVPSALSVRTLPDLLCDCRARQSSAGVGRRCLGRGCDRHRTDARD